MLDLDGPPLLSEIVAPTLVIADDTFNPVSPGDLVRRLRAVGFGDVRTDEVGFHDRFIATGLA